MSQARLRLLDIRCIKQSEVGGDEPYLLVRKNKVWSHKDMKSGMTVSLRSIAAISFADELAITLMESDRFRDDTLGGGSITSDQAGKGEQQIDFKDRGYHYQLVYEVLGVAATTAAGAPAAAPQHTPQPSPGFAAPPQQQGGFGGAPPQGGGFGGGAPQGGGFGGGGFGGGAPPQGGGFGGGGFGGGAPQGGFGGGGFGGGAPQGGFGGGGGFPQQGFAGGFPQQGFGGGGGFGAPLFGGQLDPMWATSLWLALAFLVLATADGQVSQNELMAYQRAVHANGLPDITQRFTWQQMFPMMNDGTLQNLSGYIASVLPPDRKNALIPIMLQIIVADGQAGPGELMKMQQVASWIGAQVTFTYA